MHFIIRMVIWIALAGLCAVTGESSANCKQPKNKIVLPERLHYVVAGSGRLYFHIAPDSNCMIKNLFVVPGDVLIAYEEVGDWSYVNYFSKSAGDYSGWVTSKRLQFSGASGPDMTEKDLKFYQNAQEQAKAGKLGSPWGMK